MATAAEKQKGFARQSLGDRLQAGREAMAMLKQNKWTILTDKNCSLENGRIDTQNKQNMKQEGVWKDVDRFPARR